MTLIQVATPASEVCGALALTALTLYFLAFFLAYLRIFEIATWSKLGQWHRQLFVLGILLITPMSLIDVSLTLPFTCSIGLTILYIGYGCILLSVLNLSDHTKILLSQNFGAKIVAWIGYYSYTIYLWHRFLLPEFLDSSMLRQGTWQWLSMQLLSYITAIALGYIAALLVEQPFLRLRNRLFSN